MTAALRKLSVNGWKTLEKKISLCFVTRKMQGKKIREKNIKRKILDLLKVKGITACLKKVECEQMKNFRKKNLTYVWF